MLQYQYTTLDLGGNNQRLFLSFADEQYEILSTLFLCEVYADALWLRDAVVAVMNGANEEECYTEIFELLLRKDTIKITRDHYGDNPPTCTVATADFLALLDDWCDTLRAFEAGLYDPNATNTGKK